MTEQLPDRKQDKAVTLIPLSSRGIPRWLIYLAALVGFAYLLNPTAGIIEAIPDNIPLIGNLDEGVATMLVWYGLLELFQGRRREEMPE